MDSIHECFCSEHMWTLVIHLDRRSTERDDFSACIVNVSQLFWRILIEKGIMRKLIIASALKLAWLPAFG